MKIGNVNNLGHAATFAPGESPNAPSLRGANIESSRPKDRFPRLSVRADLPQGRDCIDKHLIGIERKARMKMTDRA